MKVPFTVAVTRPFSQFLSLSRSLSLCVWLYLFRIAFHATVPHSGHCCKLCRRSDYTERSSKHFRFSAVNFCRVKIVFKFILKFHRLPLGTWPRRLARNFYANLVFGQKWSEKWRNQISDSDIIIVIIEAEDGDETKMAKTKSKHNSTWR